MKVTRRELFAVVAYATAAVTFWVSTVVNSIDPAWTIGLELLFWTALAALCYSYAGYPILVWLLSKTVAERQHNSLTYREEDLPQVTVLIVACNAEHHIRERIANVFACDYPGDRLEVLVASDGSTDATVSLVSLIRSLEHPQVRVLDFSQRRGKAGTLVDAVRQATGDVIVFTDATNQFERHSIRNLVRHFTDERIGIAVGRVSPVNERGEPVESLYWRFEMLIRRAEMRLGIMLGANGPLYAIRRNLFVKPKRPVINDDFVLPILTHLQHRCGIVHDETAQVRMLSSGGFASEFRRRCRIGAGAWQCLPVLSDLFQWRHAKQAAAFASHKLLRWIGPFLLLILLGSSSLLAANPLYRLLFALQVALYTLAAVGVYLPNSGYAARAVRVCSSFAVLNLALLAGFVRWVRQPHNVVWNPTMRPIPVKTPVMARTLPLGATASSSRTRSTSTNGDAVHAGVRNSTVRRPFRNRVRQRNSRLPLN